MKTNKQFRFHVVGLPHTYTSKEFLTCAFTQKVLNFCKMMKSLGHEVYHYGGELSNVECDEHITVMSEEERQSYFGGVDTKKHFYPVKWDPKEEYWMKLNSRAIEEIKKRSEKTDFVCIIGGNCQKVIELSLPNNMVVELGIGYEGSFAKYRVFESYAWMHYTYGKIDGKDDGRFMDAVIPNYWDLKDFEIDQSEVKENKDYIFFIGRMIERKGVMVAVETAKRLGLPIKLAGQGLESLGGGMYKGQGFVFQYDKAEYLGSVGVKERVKLMANAKVVMVPTTYLEPFGGVVIEAMLSGSPVIATDFGAFPELVIDGFNGFRFRTLGEAMHGVREAEKLDRAKIKDWATRNFSLERVKYMYQAYFEQLSELWSDGWFTEKATPEYNRYRKV